MPYRRRGARFRRGRSGRRRNNRKAGPRGFRKRGGTRPYLRRKRKFVQELKHNEGRFTGTNGAAGPVLNLVDGGLFFQVPRGNGDQERIGNKVQAKWLDIRGYCDVVNRADNTGHFNVKVMLWYPKADRELSPTRTDFLEFDGNTVSLSSASNHDRMQGFINRRKVVILKARNLRMASQKYGDQNRNDPAQVIRNPHFTASRSFRFRIPLNRTFAYDPESTQISSNNTPISGHPIHRLGLAVVISD